MPATPAFTPDYAAILALPTTARLDVLADQLEIQLHGGQASSDSPYPWPFLRLCVQQAFDQETADKETLNKSVLQADYLTRKKDEQESYFSDLKAKTDFWESPERWVQAFPAPLLYDAQRQEQYFVLPAAFVNLRRYQNLPGENTVRDIQCRARPERAKYRFCYLPTGSQAHTRLPGGLLGRWGYYTEQTAVATDPHRVYLVPPGSCLTRIADTVPLLAYYVLRDSRTSGLPDPPLQLVEDFTIVRRALELALLRTRQDKVEDNSPTPTQVQN